MPHIASLTSLESPWVHTALGGADISPAVSAISQGSGRVVHFDGGLMQNANDLFREYSRGFQFPEYFGWNWNAFHECMTELEGLPARAYLTVISNADLLLVENGQDLQIYLSQLDSIGSTWSRSFALGPAWGGGEVPFNTVFLGGKDWVERFGREGSIISAS
ncbi:barstar family protein [Kineosporia babensis]|uniref:barstar family protein n=1 Tax=Kineosporia babensis TaxID=499548 RepID=UPI0038B2953E